jgi:thiamine transport system ATP-binding protein
MIEIDELSFAYGTMSMRFSLRVQPGECMALIGPSGGESTLLSLIAGFETPLGGCVCVDGVDVGAMRSDQWPVTMLFQEHNLFSHLSVE